jgi:hypothetical protein
MHRMTPKTGSWREFNLWPSEVTPLVTSCKDDVLKVQGAGGKVTGGGRESWHHSAEKPEQRSSGSLMSSLLY